MKVLLVFKQISFTLSICYLMGKIMLLIKQLLVTQGLHGEASHSDNKLFHYQNDVFLQHHPLPFPGPQFSSVQSLSHVRLFATP